MHPVVEEPVFEIKASKILELAKEKDAPIIPIRLKREGLKIRELKRPIRFVIDYKEAKALLINGGGKQWLVVSITRAHLQELVDKKPDFTFSTPDFPNLA